MAVTIHDVAKQAGVAVGTVFRYLNGEQLRESNRVKVQEAIEMLGFKENVSAIAVLVGSLTDIFEMSVITSIERLVEKYRYNLLICDFETDATRLTERLKFLKNRAISGVIVFSSSVGAESVDVLKEYAAENVPVIIVDDVIAGFESDVVLVDNAHASFRMIEHLIHAGHRQIAMLAGPQQSHVSRERFRGFLEAMQTYNLPVDESLVIWSDFTTPGGYRAIKELYQSATRPTAIYSANYHMTLGAVLALNELHVKIPADVSFVSFDHFPALDVITPQLTVIEQPLDQIGATVGKLMIKRISGDCADFPQRIELKTRMLIRDSVQKIPG